MQLKRVTHGSYGALDFEENWNDQTCICGVGLALVGLISVPASHAFAYTGENLSKGAKISIDEARAIAVKSSARKTITDEELEKEKGGSGLRYSFDIKSGGVIHEVGVDAQTGKVLENAKEGPNRLGCDDKPGPKTRLKG